MKSAACFLVKGFLKIRLYIYIYSINEKACCQKQDENPVRLRQREKRCFQEDWYNRKEYLEVSEISRIDSIPLFKINFLTYFDSRITI